MLRNVNVILKTANLPEDEKSKQLKAAEAHLLRAKLQHTHYNESCFMAKTEWEKFPESASSTIEYEYSFAYAQSVCYPSNLQQLGPAYFKSARVVCLE